jgi:hypothetical protein
MKHALASACLAALSIILLPVSGQSQKAKVYRYVTNSQLEKLLKDMDIAFKKVPAKEDGVMFYDFERNNFKLRLHSYGGRDLWLEGIFPATSLETVNRWNQRTKFTRAVVVTEEDSTSLEAQLDCAGGVTEGMVLQFIRRFDGEVQAFAKFIKS